MRRLGPELPAGPSRSQASQGAGAHKAVRTQVPVKTPGKWATLSPEGLYIVVPQASPRTLTWRGLSLHFQRVLVLVGQLGGWEPFSPEQRG